MKGKETPDTDKLRELSKFAWVLGKVEEAEVTALLKRTREKLAAAASLDAVAVAMSSSSRK